MVADHQSSKHQGRINARVNVRFGSKADMAARPRDVRFTPESGHCGTRAPVDREINFNRDKRSFFDHD